MRLYHYTNLEALSGILNDSTSFGSEVCLWCSDSRYLNDYTEIRNGEAFLEQHFWNAAPARLREEADNIYDWYIGKCYYIASLSAKRDFLPMWGMYGRDGSGIAIEFDSDLLDDNHLLKCVYDSRLLHGLMEEISKIPEDKVLNWGNKEKTIDFVVRCVCGFKHRAYEYEDEYRLVFQDKDGGPSGFRFSNNAFIPYQKCFLPKESITRIIIGPNQNKAESEKRLKRYLEFRGFGEIKVSTSDIPYKYMP